MRRLVVLLLLAESSFAQHRACTLVDGSFDLREWCSCTAHMVLLFSQKLLDFFINLALLVVLIGPQ
jgi:hypothetical protein